MTGLSETIAYFLTKVSGRVLPVGVCLLADCANFVR
jgi:hypothetical protein